MSGGGQRILLHMEYRQAFSDRTVTSLGSELLVSYPAFVVLPTFSVSYLGWSIDNEQLCSKPYLFHTGRVVTRQQMRWDAERY